MLKLDIVAVGKAKFSQILAGNISKQGVYGSNLRLVSKLHQSSVANSQINTLNPFSYRSFRENGKICPVPSSSYFPFGSTSSGSSPISRFPAFCNFKTKSYVRNYSSDEKNSDPKKSASNEKPDTKDPLSFGFGASISGGGLANKILFENTGIEQEEKSSGHQDSSENKKIDSNPTESSKNMTPAEKRRARRMRANLPRQEEKRSASAKFASYGISIGLIIGAIGYFGQPYSKEEIEDFFNNPVAKKLLPDPVPEQMPYTLVLSLDDLLIHTSWDKEHGWRIAKRPYFDKFLSYMSSMYEIVIFSDQPSYSGEEILTKLDPYGYAPYRLYKEHTHHIKGNNYKDLSYLNRDLSKVIMLDIIPKEDSLQPENSVQVPAFTGQPGDDWLMKSIPFFEYVFMLETKDVREPIAFFGKGDLAENYEEWEKNLVETLNKDWEENKKKKTQYSDTIWGTIGSLVFGTATGGASTAQSSSKPPIPQIIQTRMNMRSNFEVQHRKMIAAADEEMKRIDEENKKQLRENTIWTVAQTMSNQKQ
ncbi:Mitochondrial import inner membrane translocase subunit TIM50 [Smittium mucronatum]|uniref:Mitochondrial import inner membrane translocase subunit TIM50 n=1 Tax=Smittium mucronatum TaxID=133383 RepID=A0A1R0H1D0_9FUNG|nr:Mitochondrial import inner membrane translocase subunit TIM50 [Smittium mucronatum]